MTDEEKIISNTSYTNKDFQSIYVELLDLVKKLTNKWDPSISNESDPGVILLKLNALIADKNNYNIDKNVLECFPLSVTQYGNARKLYDSLGYRMKWYVAATLGLEEYNTGVQFMLLDKYKDKTIKLKPFTHITDDTGEVVYTTLQLAILTPETKITPFIPVMQGVAHEYKINGNSTISVNNLDNKLRLYFDESNVAENGIFIKDSNTGDWYPSSLIGNNESWHRVDNLASYPLGNKVYEFGVLPNSNTCYIQFPEDVVKQAADGLNIVYVTSNGSKGNIKNNVLTEFLDNISIGSGNDLESANEAIKIIQSKAITNGEDPETIDDAYYNYKKTIGTFNTLVTRRDYENLLYNNNLVSNSVVADRTNDNE